MSFTGVYGGLYGLNLPYEFKNSYGNFQDRNFEKSHKTTGPRSDLRPDLWSSSNSALETAFGIIETEKEWVDTRALKQTHSTT